MDVCLMSHEECEKIPHLVPKCFLEEIKNKDLYAFSLEDEYLDIFYGVLIAREMDNWIKICWISLEKEYRGRGIGKLFIDHFLNKIRESKAFDGVYLDISDYNRKSDNDESDRYIMQKSLYELGFNLKEIEDNCYQLTREEVLGNSILMGIKASDNTCSLASVKDSQINELKNLFRDADSVMPISQNFNKEDFNQNLSCIYMSGGKIGGVILVQRDDFYRELTLSFAWSKEKTALMPMLSYVLTEFEKTKIRTVRIPVVNSAVNGIIQKMFPDLERKYMLQAIYHFM